MRRYLFFSFSLHSVGLAALLMASLLLSKPPMSYYAVDLFSLPSGALGPGGRGQASAVVAKPAEEAPAIEEEPVPHEVIRVPGKVKKKHPALIPTKPKIRSKPRPWSLLASPSATEEGEGSRGEGGGGGGAPGGAGAGIVGDAGPAFPYPWYLKAIVDRLDKEWHPPQEFETDTLCQVSFVIKRGGEVVDARISKKSGDSIYDQLALRAVLYANPLPPLPAGFPDNTLKVHMKFVGKR
jgi:TonB family protein